MTLPAIRKYYGLNIKRGQRVTTCNGEEGRVLSARGMRLRILVNGRRELHHPTWEITYHSALRDTMMTKQANNTDHCEPSLTRDVLRTALEAKGITCANVSDEALKRLRRLVNKQLRASGHYRGTARLSRARKDLKFMQMSTDQWELREAISFNHDGFIGIAGWASDDNVAPLLAALSEWLHAT